MGVAAGGAAALAATLWLLLAAPDVVFLWPTRGAEWIGLPHRITTVGIPVSLDAPLRAVFATRFVVDRAGPDAALLVEAVRGVSVSIDGAALGEREWRDGAWREPLRVPLASLAAGPHELHVLVTNPLGPTLLRVRSHDLDPPLASDTTWQVARPGEPARRAWRADDRRASPAADGQPTTSSLLHRTQGWLAAAFLSGMAMAWAAARRASGAGRAAPLACVIALGALWSAVFAGRFGRIPLEKGFDATRHLDYVRVLLVEHRLPLATEGWSMYHPPLFYLLEAAVAALTGSGLDSDAARWTLRVVPTLSGAVQIGLAAALARSVLGPGRWTTAGCMAVAGLLPMNLYMAAYVSNEALHGALAGAALLVAVRIVARPGLAPGALAGLGALLGLALLTKFTAFALVPGVVAVLAWKARYVDGLAPGRVAARCAIPLGVAALVCGAFYLRNWVLLGRPVVGNWTLAEAGLAWWQEPGFHTPAYYLSFGRSLVRPFYAGFASFADGIHATLWTDGLVGGQASLVGRHDAWSWEWMAVCAPLSIPAAALAVAGLVRHGWRAWSDPDLHARAASGVLVLSSAVLAWAVFAMTLRLPYYAQAKAFYALCLTAPLSVFVVEGMRMAVGAIRRTPAAGAELALFGWAAAWAFAVAAAFLGFGA